GKAIDGPGLRVRAERPPVDARGTCPLSRCVPTEPPRDTGRTSQGGRVPPALDLPPGRNGRRETQYDRVSRLPRRGGCSTDQSQTREADPTMAGGVVLGTDGSDLASRALEAGCSALRPIGRAIFVTVIRHLDPRHVPDPARHPGPAFAYDEL